MKHSIAFMGLMGLYPFLCTGCFQPAEVLENELENTSKETSTLRLTTRSSTGQIDYPVMVLAFDVDGNKRGQQLISSSDDQIQMKLPVGSYQISAITGFSSYTEPDDYATNDAAISIPRFGYADAPLFVGSADVELGDKNATVEVIMSSRTASMQIFLKDLPATVESTNIAISKQYGAYGMDGKYASSIVTRATCEKSEDGIWSTGVFYVFPGSEAQTVLTITIIDDSQQFSYGYTVNEPLEAGVPYTLNGIYKAGERVGSFDVTGSLVVDSWKDPKAFNFEFGEGASSDNSITEDDNVITDDVTELPTALSIWNGHVVALVMDEKETEEDLLLISLTDYTDVYSAFAVGHENDALSIATAYNEDGLTGWKIPSNFELQSLKTIYKDDYLNYLNDVISQAGGEPIVLIDPKTKKGARYLCEKATVANSFASTSTKGTAGAKTKYYLRLVKKVHVTLSE